MSVQMENLTVQKFNSISWHDSKLVGFCLYKHEGEDRVRLSLELLGAGGSLTPTDIVFKECVYFASDVYLAAKSMCADDISGAECYESSDWKNAVSEPSPFDVILGGRGFEEHLHFSVSMCPPGGTINILARDFSLESSK
ncbi:hypothetical protein [Acidicapsa ligni]|uniref:hypothetical protein n=1 Tax=Acidicapsa ligni TaxID=542300 RepID=UPI0021E07A36|nr:hypothetical protein [Acidicapsa ligni]